jgi:glutamyl-tRNA synthetase
MHVGTLRTVLYDYFLARQSEGGKLILRIEDTDQERLVEGAIEGLLATLKTLGIDYDEGPVLNADGTISEKGEYGPYVQSARLPTYRPVAEQLLREGKAYYCFCSSEELDEMRKVQMETKQALKYDRRCLRLSKEEVERRLALPEYRERATIRMKVPDEGVLAFEDGIRGRISFDAKDIDDQILMKSDGFPTYHLAVVVDDHLMEITHVLRGEEWISSTPKQVLLHQMLGWEMPVYAHVPLLLNPDKTKLSKRKGDVSVESYLAKGYLPAALINFLALLGWNPTGDREIFEREELVRLFDLSKVNRAGAVMNIEKLNWTNNHYLRALDEQTYVALCFEKGWLSGESFNRWLTEPRSRAVIERAVLVLRERLEKLGDLSALVMDLHLFDTQLEYTSVNLVWKKSTKEATLEYLKEARNFLATKEDAWFDARPEIEAMLRAWIAEHGWSNGDVLWPLRVALSAQEKSPSPFDFLWMLGKDQSLSRIDAALASLA